jgi:hypothetical protein
MMHSVPFGVRSRMPKSGKLFRTMCSLLRRKGQTKQQLLLKNRRLFYYDKLHVTAVHWGAQRGSSGREEMTEL